MNKHIKKALLHGRLVLLLGAGASAGCRNSQKEDPPLGWNLAQILADEIGNELEEGDDLSDVYAAAKKILDFIRFRTFLINIISTALRQMSIEFSLNIHSLESTR